MTHVTSTSEAGALVGQSKMRMAKVTGMRQMGQVHGAVRSSVAAHSGQARRWPHGTNATSSTTSSKQSVHSTVAGCGGTGC